MHQIDLPTPALVIDADIVRRNLSRMAEYSTRHKISVRPHVKTHKSRKLAAMQLDFGSRGLTAAKVGEAEVMAEVCEDLLLAYPAVDTARTHRIARLAAKTNLKVAIDSAEAADALALAARTAGTTIGILVDLDVGLGRTGVQSPDDAWLLAEHVLKLRELKLSGLFCYPGNIWTPAAEQGAALRVVSGKLEQTIAIWRSHGVAAEVVSGGSTPSAYQSHLVPEYTEIRPGTYIFNDMNTVRGNWCALEDCAARIVATVVSTAVPGQVVIDAGSKTLTSDRNGLFPDSGFGHVVEYPQAIVTKLTEEHGQIDIRGCAQPPRLGERVTVIPNHICPCVNLIDAAWWMDGGQCEPLPIDARGKLS
jgi:D-serine deaminase-like pyridoxal phosphate-dependent protein